MRVMAIGKAFIGFAFCAVTGLQAAGAAAGKDQKAGADEWRLVGGNAENHHFSPLDQINAKNVQRLGLAWFADIPAPGSSGLVGTPLVVDGVVYQSSQNSVVFANDLRTGRLLWTHDPGVVFTGDMIPSMGRINRGVGVWGDNVFVGTADCRLVAIDRTSGKKSWEADVCRGDPKFTITEAPRVGAGKVFIGPANMDDGTRRGFVDAYDAKTGKRLWRFHTVPGDPSLGFENPAMKMASATWGKEYWKHAGGGSVWGPMTYDPALNLLYFGTSSASPDAPTDRGEGRTDELFQASLVAVNADTGEYVWHYQQTPVNGWNYDSSMPITIAELRIDGKERRVLLHAPKNGYFYMLDAQSGKLLAADQYGIRVNWSSHVDMATGRPALLPDAQYWNNGKSETVVYPSSIGAHNWNPMAFSPATGLVYIPAIDFGSVSYFEQKTASDSDAESSTEFALSEASLHYGLASEKELQSGSCALIAWDPVARKVRWEHREKFPKGSGTLATAGNLVFYGKGDGLLRAFAADSGEELWSSRTEGAIEAAPVSVMVGDEQYLLVAAGSGGSSGTAMVLGDMATTERARQSPARLLAYKLGGTASPPASIGSAAFPRPPVGRFPDELAMKGREAMHGYACNYCHGGEDLKIPRNTIGDLRKISAGTYASLRQIVIGGAYKHLGMPQFSDMPDSDLELIRAYIINRAWDAYESQEALLKN